MENARVQDERVEATEARDRLVHRAGDRGGVARVGLDEGRAGLARHGGAPRLVPTGEDDSGALAREAAPTIAAPMPEVPPVTRVRTSSRRPIARAIIPPADAPCNPAAERSTLVAFVEKGGRMEAGSAASGTRPGVAGDTELARNALGLPAILFCIVTGSAPLAAMMFNDPLSGYGIGISVPAAFWLATIAFTLFSVAYIEMARRVTTAGGIYSYMSYGFGRIVGLGAAVAIAAAYILFAAGRERRHVVLRPDEHPQPVGRLRHGLAHLRVLLHRADVPDHVLPRRDRSPRSSASA